MAAFKQKKTSNDSEWESLGAQPAAVSSPQDGEWEYSNPQTAQSGGFSMSKFDVPKEQPGIVGRAWEAANTPVADFGEGNQGRTKKAIGNLVANAVNLGAAAGKPGQYLSKPRATFDRDFSKERDLEADNMLDKAARGEKITASDKLRHLFFGMGDSAENVTAAFTSPLSIGTAALGGVANSYTRVADLARKGELATAAGFTGQGLWDAAKAGYDYFFGDTPEEKNIATQSEKAITGLSMAAGGAGGASHAWQGNPAKGQRPFLKGSMADRPVEGVPGLTAGERYRKAREAGVNLDLAQAGEGKTARWIADKAANTPGGAGRSARFRQKQNVQMEGATDAAANSFDPATSSMDIDSRGTQLQDALTMAKDVAHDNARSGFVNDIQDLFDYSTADTSGIVQAAEAQKQKLLTGEISSLRPNETIKILDQIIDAYGDQHNTKSMFDSLFRDRSRLMKTHFSDALVRGEGESALRSVADAMRKSLEDAAAKKSPNKLNQFNDAMKNWQDYIETFGDSRSPINRAMSNPDPGKALDAFVQGSGASSSRGSVAAIRALKKVAPDFVKMIKSEFVRRLKDPKSNGLSENYGRMLNRLNDFNEPFMKELFTPEEMRNLQAMASTGATISKDINPSGSGRYQGQTASAVRVGGGMVGAGTAMAFGHPVAGAALGAGAMLEPIAANIAARVQQSPRVVDYLMGYDAPQTRASLATSQAAAPGGRAIANPFGQQRQTGQGLGRRGLFRKAGAGNKQAGAVNADLLTGGLAGMIGRFLDHSATSSKSSLRRVAQITEKTDSILADQKKLSKAAKAIANQHNANGGGTMHLAEGDMSGRDAFAVSAYPELQQVIEGDKVTPQQVEEYLKRPDVQEALRSDPRVSVGTWAEGGKTYLDVSAAVSDLGSARKLGQQFDQMGIWDLQNSRFIGTGGSGSGKPPANAPKVAERLKGIVDPESLDAVHYSPNPDITELDPSKMMESNFSSEKKIAQAYPDKYKPVTFLGERETYRNANERQVLNRPNRYGTGINKSRIYDINADPEGLIAEAVKKSQADGNYGNEAVMAYLQDELRNRGYSGTLNSQSGVITSWDKLRVNKEMIPEQYDRLLTKEERAGFKTEYTTKQFVKTLSELPPLKEWIDAAKAGEVGRKWYQRSNQAFDALLTEAPDYFTAADRQKFTDFVAALSPQQGVYANMREALGAWKKWVDAGRPTDVKKLEKLLDRELVMSGAKVPNATKALLGEDMWPSLDKNQYFKVPNFAKNLRGLLSAVTNDSWMGIFSGITNPKKVTIPEGYHAMSVLTRQAAKELGWHPAEAQAAIWVFTRTLAEKSGWNAIHANKIGGRIGLREALKGLTNDDMKAYADDFADIMRNDPETRALMKRLGVDLGKLDEKLGNIEPHPQVAHGIEGAAGDNLTRTADRIQRARDGEDAAQPKSIQDEGEGSTDFNVNELNEAPANRDGVVPADKLHVAELGQWQSAFDSRMSEYGKLPRDEFFAKGKSLRGGDMTNAREAAKIGGIIASGKSAPGVEVFVNRRGGKTLGALQIDTYGSEKGYPITIDWLATHPEIILGNVSEKGIGTELMHQAIKRASELGVGIQLQSATGARSFYEKMGMKPSATLGDHYHFTPEQVQEMAGNKKSKAASGK